MSENAIVIGASVTNSQLAWHPVVRDRFPVLHNRFKIELAKRVIVRAFANAR